MVDQKKKRRWCGYHKDWVIMTWEEFDAHLHTYGGLMETTWKRPKTIPSETEHIETPGCGTLHLTKGYEEDRLIEIRAVIGRNGVCGAVLLDSIAKLMSMYLQSPEPKYKIVEKFKKQFLPDTKGNQITCGQGKGRSCVEIIAEKVVKELEA